MTAASAVAARTAPKRLSTLDKWLPLWIGLAMVAGLLLGRFVPALSDLLSHLEVGGTRPSVRRHLHDIIEEYGRHTGHVDLLREAGFRLVAATLSPSAVALGDYRPAGKVALLLGTEGAGLSAAWQAVADDHVTIPMTDRVDSLNVATAAAILAYALR